MVTHGRTPTENSPAPTNGPVRTGGIYHAIKKDMPMSPPQEFSRPRAGRGGITPPISNSFSYPSSAPTKLKRVTPQVNLNQTTFERFDSLYRASPSPKWFTCPKIPHREREQHMASPASVPKSSCLPPPTADNGRVAETLQSSFSSRITSASIELRGKNATNDSRNDAVTSNSPQCNLKKQTNDLHYSKESSENPNFDDMKEKNARTEMERGGEGVVEVVESEEIKDNNPKRDRVLEATSSSAEPGKRKDRIVAIQSQDIEVNVEQQKQDGGVDLDANNTFSDENLDNDENDEIESPKIGYPSSIEQDLEGEKINSRVIEKQGKCKDTVVVDQTAKGIEEKYSSYCQNETKRPWPHLEQNGKRSGSFSSTNSKIVPEISNIGTTPDLVDEKVEFSSTRIVSRESSPIPDRRASLRSAVISPCVLVSAMQSQKKKTVSPNQRGLGKVVLSAIRGEVVLRNWFVICISDENDESPTTQEQSVSSSRRNELKYRLCGDLVTYQSTNNGSRLPPVTSGVISSRQTSNLVLTEDGDLYRLEGECGAAREWIDNHKGFWSSSAREAFRSGFPVYWRSTLRQLLLKRNELKEGVKSSSSTAENMTEGRKHDLAEIQDRAEARQRHILPQNQDGAGGGTDATHHRDNTAARSKLQLAASVALDEKANPKQGGQQRSSPRQLRPRCQKSTQQQERRQELKRKLPTSKPKSNNTIKQKKKRMKEKIIDQPPLQSSHHPISGGSSATRRSPPLRSTSRHRSSNSVNLVTKQGPPPLTSCKSKNKPPRLAIKKQQVSKKNTSSSPPSIKTKKTIQTATPPRAYIRKSRSGRHIVSSLEWWKGERLMSTRPGLQGSPVVVIGRGDISGFMNCNSKELKKNGPIVKRKKKSSIRSTDGSVIGSGRGSNATTITRVDSGGTKASSDSGSSAKQSHKDMTVPVVVSNLKNPMHNDKVVKIKAKSTPVEMKMTCRKQESSVLYQQEGRVQQLSHQATGSWTEEQTNALRQSSLDIPPTTHNYWGRIAESVPGKTAFECQTKHYESVISSKNVTQCTDVNALSANNKKNGKKRGRRPTAREQFSRYLQMVGGNAVIPSTVLEDTSKMNADDLLQDSSMRMAKKAIKLPQSAGFAAVQVEQKGVSVPVSPSPFDIVSSDPGVTRKYMTQLAKAVRGKGGGISSSGLPPSKAIFPAVANNTIAETIGAKRELPPAAAAKKERDVEFSSLSPSSVVDSDEAPVIRIRRDMICNEDELDESDLN